MIGAASSFRFARAVVPALLLLASGGAAARAASAGGAIYLTTLPSGADAWVDGAYVGRTPVFVDGLAAGKHIVTTAKTGWDNHVQEVTTGERLPFQFVDELLDRSARAPRGMGRLAVHAQVKIADVSIDGAETRLAADGTLDLAPGPHELAIRTARGRIVRRIAIYADTTTNVVLRPGADDDDRTAVIAPASQYLPPSDVSVDGGRLVIRHNGHFVTGNLGDPTLRVDGSPTGFDSAPTFIDGKLYLPLELFVRIGAAPLQVR